MDEDDRACLFLDLDLSSDLRLVGGSELGAATTGRLVIGSKEAPGLADRDMRGQAMSSNPPLCYNEQQLMLSCPQSLSLRHAISKTVLRRADE